MKLCTCILSIVSCAVLIGLTGCAHYKAKPLRMLAKRTQSTSTKQSISFDYEVFTVNDCIKYLDRDTIAQGYQPIQITLTNNSDHYMSFSTKNFNINCLSAREVATKVHTNTVGRAVGYGVAGLFIWPLIIPAIVDGIGSSKANEQLDIDFSHKVLHNQTVKPYTTINGLIFVSCDDFDDNFTLTVTDQTINKHFILSSAHPQLYI